ncbi:hypothetical protein [Microbacterium flavum]|uniref:hypothetical protein n=1 Tax=Microbacterium flavum TaxID=415216 RepID=UPI0024ADAC40|nr:hypothetical protein [Microbacterium flavum]
MSIENPRLSVKLGRVLVPIVAALSLVGVSVNPAYADELPPSLDDAAAILGEVVPDVLDETSDADHIQVDLTSDAAAVEVAGQSDAAPDTVSPGISFSIDYVSEQAETEEDGLTVLRGQDDTVAAYVQPTGFGVRVLTAISDSTAPTSYDYTFDVPENTQLVESEYAYYLESGDDLLGTVYKPWATDAQGNSVPTTYSWSEGTLTQHVDLTSPGIEFPVIADPAWGYTYYYSVTKTAAQNKALLKKCFNCYFPVEGAPKAFPAAGKLLPLRVAGLNFECKFKSEFTSGTSYFGFQFDATKNHVDGLGSNIIFEFRTINGKKNLVVSAYIANDSKWINNGYYRLGAALNWQNFAKNLNNA